MRPIPRRHEDFDGLAEKFRPRIAEHPLGLSIDHDDGSCPVNHHHGARRSLDDQPEPLLRGNCRFRVMTSIRARAATDPIVARAIAGVDGLPGVALSVVGVHSHLAAIFGHRQRARNPVRLNSGEPSTLALRLAALPLMACCTPCGAWLTPASIRLYVSSTEAAYRRGV